MFRGLLHRGSVGGSSRRLEVVSIQVLILLAVYFFPTPGGTGAAELGSAVLMAQILLWNCLTIYVVLWRGIMMYIAVAIGVGDYAAHAGQDTVVAPRSFGDVEKKLRFGRTDVTFSLPAPYRNH